MRIYDGEHHYHVITGNSLRVNFDFLGPTQKISVPSLDMRAIIQRVSAASVTGSTTIPRF